MTGTHHNPPELFPRDANYSHVALTVVCCPLLDPKWKLEIEAVAAA